MYERRKFQAHISLSRCFRTPGAPINPSSYWNAALSVSCPFMASNYANSYLVPISFWSRSGCWPCLKHFPISFYRRVSRFVTFQKKSGASLFLPCSHKHAVAHIYIYAVESKLGPKIAFFWVKTWSKFSLFFLFLFFQKSSSFCRENDILKKNEQKKRQKKTPFFESKLGPILLRNILGPSLDSTFLLILGYFYLFEKMLKPLFL